MRVWNYDIIELPILYHKTRDLSRPTREARPTTRAERIKKNFGRNFSFRGARRQTPAHRSDPTRARPSRKHAPTRPQNKPRQATRGADGAPAATPAQNTRRARRRGREQRANLRAPGQRQKQLHKFTRSLNAVKKRVVFSEKFFSCLRTRKFFLRISTLNKLFLTAFIFRAVRASPRNSKS